MLEPFDPRTTVNSYVFRTGDGKISLTITEPELGNPIGIWGQLSDGRTVKLDRVDIACDNKRQILDAFDPPIIIDKPYLRCKLTVITPSGPLELFYEETHPGE